MLTYEQLQAFTADMKARPVTEVRALEASNAVVVITLKTRRGPTEPDDELIAGPCDAVLDFVAWRIQHDRCTPHYEHMLWAVTSVERSRDHSTTGAVRMRRSRYAGD